MKRITLALASAATLMAAACSDAIAPEARVDTRSAAVHAPPPPALVTVSADGVEQAIWPWTAVDFSGSVDHTGNTTDPVNLVFTGEADPRNLRAFLMSLPGNRAGTPFAPFDCVWKDAIGGNQVTYSELGGWAGSVAQLECGEYGPFRYHLRLFQAGPWTLGAAHVEILIPGTHIHQILSWEVAEQFVMVDFMRGAALAGMPTQTGPISAAPSYREIIPDIYNGLPPELRLLAGGPLGDVVAAVPVLTNGSATILPVGNRMPVVAERRSYAHDLTFNRVIPKPFCGGPSAFVHVAGPFRLRQEVVVSAAGVLSSHTFAEAELTVRPVNPLTGQMGDPASARVREEYASQISDGSAFASLLRDMRLQGGGTPETLRTNLRVGPHGVTFFRSDEHCAS